MIESRFVRLSLTSLGTFALALAAMGCPGTLTQEEKDMFQGGGVCPDVPALFASKCGSAGCHAADATTVDLASPGVEARLVSVAGSDACSNAILANPIDPEGSLLYEKLGESPPCGSRMPFGTPLSTYEINCIKAWIEGLDPQAGQGGAGGTGGMGGMGGTGGM